MAHWLKERWAVSSSQWKAMSSIPSRAITQGFKIIEENVLTALYVLWVSV